MGAILGKMKAKRVFSVTREGDGFLFEELCDRAFAVILDKDEVRQLAAELLAMVDGE